jgi:hypothetical protein
VRPVDQDQGSEEEKMAGHGARNLALLQGGGNSHPRAPSVYIFFNYSSTSSADMHHSTPHQLIQAGLWKLGWSIAIVTAIAYFIRSILMYINEDRIKNNLNEGIYLVSFFCVVIILLTIFLQQCNFISARLGIKIQVH